MTDNKLATRDVDRVPDAYERDYMRGEGMVLYRDKTSSPWQMHAICGAVAALMILKVLMVPAAWGEALIALPLIIMIWVLFSVLRVTVSEGHVNIQLGLFGPKIPIPAIESVEAVEYGLKFGGWGIRRNPEGEWLYNLPGDGGRAVRIVWRTRKGKRKVTYVATRETEQLAATIEQARAALPAGKSMAALPEADGE